MGKVSYESLEEHLMPLGKIMPEHLAPESDFSITILGRIMTWTNCGSRVGDQNMGSVNISALIPLAFSLECCSFSHLFSSSVCFKAISAGKKIMARCGRNTSAASANLSKSPFWMKPSLTSPITNSPSTTHNTSTSCESFFSALLKRSRLGENAKTNAHETQWQSEPAAQRARLGNAHLR